MHQFERYIGIDYSGAETPISSLAGLRIYEADWLTQPKEVAPPPGPRKYWTRRGIAEWLANGLSSEKPTLVGLDHAFSFPLRYFEKYRLPLDWREFLEDFCEHWPTHKEHTSVRDVSRGQGTERCGDPSWLRLTEQWTGAAKSVFRFGVPGQVAASTHAGLPWLRCIRRKCGDKVHFWPFDGWEIPKGRSVIAEVYPSLWMRRFPSENRNDDQQAAYSVAAWLRRADTSDSLGRFLDPPLQPEERTRANVEGWILGVV